MRMPNRFGRLRDLSQFAPAMLMPGLSLSWEDYEYGGETDSALVVRWPGLPYHVAFWRNYVPIWFFPDKVGFYFGWIEAAPYECLCDDDREHMSLEIIEEGSSVARVRWAMDLVTFGGRIYRGNTRVVEDYEFRADGTCVRQATLYHGTELDPKRNKDGYEISEFGVVNPPGTAPVDNLLRGQVVDRVIDPSGGRQFDLLWEEDSEGIVRSSGWREDVAQWRAQVHMLMRKGNVCPYVAFGRDTMPAGYYPQKYLVWGLSFEKSVLTFSHWPRKMDEYYVHENRSQGIRDLALPTHTPILSCQFRRNCDEIASPLTFRWLIGVAGEEEMLTRSRKWLVEGEGSGGHATINE